MATKNWRSAFNAALTGLTARASDEAVEAAEIVTEARRIADISCLPVPEPVVLDAHRFRAEVISYRPREDGPGYMVELHDGSVIVMPHHRAKGLAIGQVLDVSVWTTT